MIPSVESVAEPAPENGAALQELQRRVLALEQAVARLQDPQAMEERITERLAQMPVAIPPPAPGPYPEPELPQFKEPTGRWGGGWGSWLFVDMWQEARTLIKLIFDQRYMMAWTSRIVVLTTLPLILTSHWWLTLILCGFPWIDGLRGILFSAVNLVLAFALYKTLSREVRRYNDYTRR